MKINSEYLPIKLHYLFLMGGTAPLVPLLPVYMMNNLHMSYIALGLIYTVLPFVGLLAKSISGALADFLHAHRKIFLGSIIVTALGYFSIFFCPKMYLQNSSKNASVQFDCSTSSYIRYNIPNTCGHEKNIREQSSSNCKISCTVKSDQKSDIYSSWNLPSSETDGNDFTFMAFTNLSHVDIEGTSAFFLVQNISYKEIQVNFPSCTKLIHLMDCSAKCDNGDLMEYFGSPLQVPLYSYDAILSSLPFWIFFMCVIVAWSGFAISVVMSDTICFQVLGRNFHLYGNQRMFGSIGWGAVAIITGYLIDLNSEIDDQKNYTPAFILTICILSIDFLTATRLEVKSKENSQINVISIYKVLVNPRVAIFIACCIIVGISTGVLWTYQLILVESVAHAWDCHFAHMKLLQGLIMGVQCFFGELPFFFISGKIIKKVGHVQAMTIAIASFGLRFILFNTISNPWLFLPVELLGGVTFGLFYAVMTSYANLIAPPGAHATLQGICGASFEGLGIAIGAFVGGAMFTVMPGGRAFMYIGTFNVVFALAHTCIQAILDKCSPITEPASCASYEQPKKLAENEEHAADLLP